MPSRKRSLAVADGEDGENELSLQHRIRNMWQFANLCQWIYIFGKAAKIDEAIDVEVRPHIDESLGLHSSIPINAYFTRRKSRPNA